jgi:capsular polysaccharide biosynthesis protein
MSESPTVYVIAERGNDIIMHWFLFIVSGLHDLSHLPKPIRFHTRISEEFQRETLELLKPDYEYVENTTGYNIVHHEGAPIINKCHVLDHYYHFVRDLILVKNNLAVSAPPTRRVYISRSKSHLLVSNNGRKKRQIIDEHILMDKLKAQGFECLYLEDYTLREKIQLFQESKLIVSPNGGALTMCYFAHPQTTIFILRNKNTLETQYSHICDVLSIPVMYYENVRCLDSNNNITSGEFNEVFSIQIPDHDDLLSCLP